jgi:hypothetical protein
MTARNRRRPTGRVVAQQVTEQQVPASEVASIIREFEESISELEARLQEPGWVRFTALGEQEFTREGLGRIAAVCRLMTIKNPLIRRGLSLRSSYVWGQGVSISCPAQGRNGDQDVNKVVQDFLDDPSNLRTFTSAAARKTLEQAAYTDGTVHLALFTNPVSGRVQVRVLPFEEITDVVCNPDDQSEPWFYRREWTRFGNDGTQTRVVEFYPALGYSPTRSGRFPGVFRDKDGFSGKVIQNAPVVQVKVNAPLHWKFGIPDCYAAVDWAAAYKEFLADWAKLTKSLAKIAWQLTSPGNRKPASRTRVAQQLEIDSTTGEAQRPGGMALTSGNAKLEAVSKSGATINADSGRPLAAMVSSALDVPVTMLLGDPGITGARAVAESLDAPTELMAQERRSMWTDVLDTVLSYVIDQAILTPQGELEGREVAAPWGKRVELSDDTDRAVTITWPDLDDVPMETIIKGIVEADSTGRVPAELVAELLMKALGINNVDEWLEKIKNGEVAMTDDDSQGQAAADDQRRGRDPNSRLQPEPETPDDEPDDEDETTDAGDGGNPRARR